MMKNNKNLLLMVKKSYRKTKTRSTRKNLQPLKTINKKHKLHQRRKKMNNNDDNVYFNKIYDFT